MPNKRERTKAQKECNYDKLLRVKTDCTIRIASMLAGIVMAIGSIYCFTVSGNYVGGVVSAFSTSLLACVAAEYKVIELDLKRLKLKVRH
jgi:hypothetical protein